MQGELAQPPLVRCYSLQIAPNCRLPLSGLFCVCVGTCHAGALDFLPPGVLLLANRDNIHVIM
eukprot:240945-Chlamydomonas_euryale.AAC.4